MQVQKMIWSRKIKRKLLTFALGVTFLCFLLIAAMTPDVVFPTGSHPVQSPDDILTPNKRSPHRTPERTILHNDGNGDKTLVDKSEEDNRDIRVELWPRKEAYRNRTLSPQEIRTYTNQFKCLYDSDCARFQHLLDNWNATRPKAVIYVLTQAIRLFSLRNMLRSLDLYFNKQFQYPVIIFHEDDLNEQLRDTIRRDYTASQVFFHEVSFALLPTYIRQPIPDTIPCTSHIGYRHMCRFQAKTVYELPIVTGLDYMWRLDDDSLLTQPIGYDVFEYMRSHQLIYGYNFISRDNHNCVKGLWNATRIFIKAYDIKTEFFENWLQPQIFYNNFEISSLSLWQGDDYRNYIEFLDHLGGIFEHRWGDAPIKSLAVSMFVPETDIHDFSDIGYQHAKA